jgi:hypothetical protein
MVFDMYNFRIPSWAICPIEYGEYDSLSDEDISDLEIFLECLPPGGFWSWEDEEEFASCNSINYLGGSIVNATYRTTTGAISNV